MNDRYMPTTIPSPADRVVEPFSRSLRPGAPCPPGRKPGLPPGSWPLADSEILWVTDMTDHTKRDSRDRRLVAPVPEHFELPPQHLVRRPAELASRIVGRKGRMSAGV